MAHLRKAIREQIKKLHEARQALQVTSSDGTVAIISDPRDIEDFHKGGVVYGEDDSGASVELSKKTAKDAQMVANEGMSDEEWADAKEKERLEKHPEKDKILKLRQIMDKEKQDKEDEEEQAEYDKGWYNESLREAIRKEITKLHEKIDHPGKTCVKAHPDKSHTAWERTQK